MEITIRQATTDDFEAICSLFNEIDALHRENLPHIFQKPNGPTREYDYYLELMADETVGLFIAEMEEILVGFVHAKIRDTSTIPLFVPRCYAMVDSIVVNSVYQHHGIGKKLMNAMQEWAIAKGATFIELNVYEFNESAKSFYERLGYTTISRRMRKEL